VGKERSGTAMVPSGPTKFNQEAGTTKWREGPEEEELEEPLGEDGDELRLPPNMDVERDENKPYNSRMS